MNNKRSFLSSIGLLLSFIGMTGLVLSIISLIPLNGYNIYTTVITSIKLLQFEHERTHEDWTLLSQDAKIYLIFLTGSCFSSLFEIIITFIACCRNRTNRENIQIIQTEEEQRVELNKQQQDYKIVNKKSWFIRITCLTLLIQIIFSLFGTHIIYKTKSDVNIIPIEIQQNTFISCAILWINYLSLTLFATILLFASFFILLSAYSRQSKHVNQNEETRPLIL